MRELGVPVATDQASLTDMVWANAERFGDAISFRRRVDDSWQDVTAREFAWQVLGVAKGLLEVGLRPGDRVAVPSAARYEALLVDFAIWTVGCAIAPPDSGARRIDLAGPAVDELTELGKDVDDELVHRRRLGVRADDVAVADPTVLTHRDLLGEVRSTIARYPRLIGLGNSMLVHLPLGHPFARVMSLCCAYTRTTLGHSYHADDPLADLGTFRPTAVVAGTALLHQVHDAAKRKAHAEDRGRVFDAAEAVAVEYGAATTRAGVSLALRAKHFAASKFVYPKLRVALGGRCVGVICVGPPLDEHLARFFLGIGIPVYEGDESA